jgi:hypothetical protein
MFKKVMQTLCGRPRFSVHESWGLRHLYAWKSIYCSHNGPCFQHWTRGFASRFIKGLILNASFKFLLSLMQDINQQVRMSISRRLCHILFMRNFQVIYSGLFAGLLGALYKMLLCLCKHNFSGSMSRKLMDFVCGFLSGVVLMPICFTKPYRKLLTIFALSLAFECIFKLIFAKKSSKPPTRFESSYIQVKDKDGEIINKFIPPQYRPDYSFRDDASFDESDAEE